MRANAACRFRWCVLSLLLALSCSLATAGQKQPTKINGDDLPSHRLNPPPIVHREMPKGYTSLRVFLHVVVTPSGEVHVSKEIVAKLLAAFRDANYFSLKDEYKSLITDNPTCVTSIQFDNFSKSVTDYVWFGRWYAAGRDKP